MTMAVRTFRLGSSYGRDAVAAVRYGAATKVLPRYQSPMRFSSRMASKAARANHPMEVCPKGMTMSERPTSGPDGAPRIAADLKDGLGQPFPPARGELGDARRFGMEDRRTPTDKRDGEQDGEKAVCRCEREQSGEGEAHPHSQRVGSRVQVGVTSHEGLQERGGHLKHQRDDAYLGESEAEIIFEERVDSRYYRLHHVVEQVCGADHEEYRVHGSAPCRCTCRSGKMSGCGTRWHYGSSRMIRIVFRAFRVSCARMKAASRSWGGLRCEQVARIRIDTFEAVPQMDCGRPVEYR